MWFCETANEVCDKFAAAGSHANLITYLTQELNMPLVAASNTLTNFNGTSSFTPLIGALLADSFAGRFSIIIAGCIIYELVSLFLSPLPLSLSLYDSQSLVIIAFGSLDLDPLHFGGLSPSLPKQGSLWFLGESRRSQSNFLMWKSWLHCEIYLFIL